MLYYFDSSAVVKRYAEEKGSQWVVRITDSAVDAIYISQIGIVEIAAALSRKRRTRELTAEAYEAALFLFLDEVRREIFGVMPVQDEVVQGAIRLTQRHALRGYDAVQLASALTLNGGLVAAGLSPLVFVSADAALCQAAEAEGLVGCCPAAQE